MTQDRQSQILEALERAAGTHGVGATKAPTVRVRIDWLDESRDPITLDDVSAQTGWVSDAIDELDPFPGSFTLEVSSPGLARPLRRARDF